MSAAIWQELLHPPASDRYGALLESGNRPGARGDQLSRELSEQVAGYLIAVRDAKELPPHAYPGGFFMDAFPASDIATLAKAQDRTAAPLVPVAPLGQRTSLTDPNWNESFSVQTMPDLGRRVQLWWDELAPGHPPLRPDEAVRFVRRGEWWGRVTEIADDRFAAIVWDRARRGSVERVEFFRSQLSRGDRARLAEDVELYWTIGYVENQLGERTGASRVRIKRVRPRPPELRREAEAEAAELAEILDFPPDPPAAR